MKKFGLFIFSCFFMLNFLSGGYQLCSQVSAFAQEQADWKQEYTDLCAKTQNAMGLPAAELKEYIARCDKLQERIDKLDGPQAETERKVYTKRLKMCRDLYLFALEYKENKQ